MKNKLTSLDRAVALKLQLHAERVKGENSRVELGIDALLELCDAAIAHLSTQSTPQKDTEEKVERYTDAIIATEIRVFESFLPEIKLGQANWKILLDIVKQLQTENKKLEQQLAEARRRIEYFEAKDARDLAEAEFKKRYAGEEGG